MALDEFAWRVRLARRRKARQRKFRVAAGVIALTITILGWYLGYYIQRPSYALEQAAAALAAHDVQAFQRRVDIASMTASGYDDLTYVLFSGDTHLKAKERSASGKFYEKIKDSVAAGIVDSIETAVGSGTWPSPEGGDPLKGRQLGIDFEYLMEYSHLRDTTLLHIDSVERDGSAATANITVRDEGTALEFPLQLRMERGDTGWRVVRVTNYRAYLEAVQKAAASNLGRYIDATRPIVDRYNGVFRSKQREFRNLTETGRSTYTTVYRKSLTHLLQEDMIPLLKKYQKELDGVDVPHGAQYLAAQRKAATEAFIGAYESFVKGLNGGTTEDFARAETLHKMALTYDLRVGDMIRRGAVSAETPATP